MIREQITSLTKEEVEVRIIEVLDEIESLEDQIADIEIGKMAEYMIREGFWEVEEVDGEDYVFFPVAEASEMEVPE